MRDRTLITTGAVGAVLAAVCCATPLLAVVLGAVGLAGWLPKADYVVIPVLIVSRLGRLWTLSPPPSPRLMHERV